MVNDKKGKRQKINNSGPNSGNESLENGDEVIVKKNVMLTFANIVSIFPKAKSQIFSLSFVYFFEYCCINCFADRT